MSGLIGAALGIIEVLSFGDDGANGAISFNPVSCSDITDT